MAHRPPTRRALEAGDRVIIDVHPIVDGYSADLCRTVRVGQPTGEQQTAYDLYLKARQATIARIQAGIGMIELEETMHGMLTDAGRANHIMI